MLFLLLSETEPEVIDPEIIESVTNALSGDYIILGFMFVFLVAMIIWFAVWAMSGLGELFKDLSR